MESTSFHPAMFLHSYTGTIMRFNYSFSSLSAKSVLSAITLSLLTTPAFAAKVTSVNVDNGIVYFLTDESKSGTRPVCVDTGNEQFWAFSLQSTEGKNLYRALLTANASGKSIDVESANDCQAIGGYERPQSISVQVL